MTKLFEVILPETAAEVVLKVGEIEAKLKFNKVTMRTASELMNKGIDVFSIFTEDKQATVMMNDMLTVLFQCMTSESREEFNNDFSLFLNFIDLGNINLFQEAFNKVMSISLPKSEDEDQK